jgi:hypothetical protein
VKLPSSRRVFKYKAFIMLVCHELHHQAGHGIPFVTQFSQGGLWGPQAKLFDQQLWQLAFLFAGTFLLCGS